MFVHKNIKLRAKDLFMTAIKSMTGYASMQTCDPSNNDVISIAIKAVNSRYLESLCSCNYELGSLEQEINRILKNKIKRGKINISISYQLQDSNALELNTQVLNSVLDHLSMIQKEIKLRNEANHTDYQFDALRILTFPGVAINHAHNADSSSQAINCSTISPEQEQIILNLFNQVLEKFDQQRIKEGEALQAILEQKINKVEELLSFIGAKQPYLVSMERDRLMQKIKGLKIDIDPSRFESEVALLTQKSDITEEYDRLKCHTKAVLELIQPNDQPYEATGKKLDFLMQELMRETNTLASKASTLDLVDIAVELKVLIDQMREQIQNIE